MLLIPNYPYYGVFFYTTLGIFFLCLTGRENRDVEFSLVLPVRKAEIVTARVAYAIALELAQLLLAVPFAVLRARILPAPNEVGMEANTALFGLSLILFAVFNGLFFPIYYRNPAKPGKAFLIASTGVMLYMVAAESLTHVVPFFRFRLDTADPLYMPEKLATLAVGALVFAAVTALSTRASQKRFVTLDL
jgi:hypothetical protein